MQKNVIFCDFYRKSGCLRCKMGLRGRGNSWLGGGENCGIGENFLKKGAEIVENAEKIVSKGEKYEEFLGEVQKIGEG